MPLKRAILEAFHLVTQEKPWEKPWLDGSLQGTPDQNG